MENFLQDYSYSFDGKGHMCSAYVFLYACSMPVLRVTNTSFRGCPPKLLIVLGTSKMKTKFFSLSLFFQLTILIQKVSCQSAKRHLNFSKTFFCQNAPPSLKQEQSHL